jgi:hypothetical protein
MAEENYTDNPELWIRTITETTGTREIIEDLSLLSDEELMEKANDYPELEQLVINRRLKRFL